MTKKDYVAIARAINEARTNGARPFERKPGEVLDDAAVFIADACASDNPRFDRSRFLEACGIK